LKFEDRLPSESVQKTSSPLNGKSTPKNQRFSPFLNDTLYLSLFLSRDNKTLASPRVHIREEVLIAEVCFGKEEQEAKKAQKKTNPKER
jgi:hypothetical protein